MSYRLVADENVELATITYLRKLGHYVERIGDIPDLDFGSSDEKIAAYARTTERLILTQDDDFFTAMDIEEAAGVCFQRDKTLSARAVGDIVGELSPYLDGIDVTLEYVSDDWLRDA